ncbi:MAG: type II toxin-antitoxin system prevent-host-death family antitoxin [Bacteroidota bacterium]
MDIINYTEARNKLSWAMDQVCENHVPLAITRRNGKAVVMLSLDDYNAWEETMYLMRSENNKQRLLQAIKNVDAEKLSPHELIEDDE